MASSHAQAYHNLSLMLSAGVPILKSLNTSVAGLRGSLARTFSEIARNVSLGNSLADSMAQHPGVFARMDVMLVEAAEASGNLPDCLQRLAEWHEFCLRLKRIIVTGMLLPMMVLHAAAFIVPFREWFLRSLTTNQYLLRVICILAVLYVPAAVIWAIVSLTPATGPLRRMLDGFILKIPLVGRAFKKLALSRYCRVFHMLYKAGIPVTQCAEFAAETTGNVVFAGWVKGACRSAQLGHPLSDGFSRELPRDFLEAWQVGEETGELDNVTERLANMAAESSELLFGEISKWLPRIIYFFICLWLIKMIFASWGSIYSIRAG